MNPPDLIFDGDDAVWFREGLFSAAYAKFFNLMCEIFGKMVIDFGSQVKRLHILQPPLYEEFGVRRGRIAREMLGVYHDMCECVDQRFSINFYNAEHIAEINKIADEPFAYWRWEWLPEAESTLELLKSKGHKLCLLTRNDDVLWPEIKKFMKLHRFFREENMLQTEKKKTTNDFIKVSNWTRQRDGKHKWIAIGNSWGDIDPALEISPQWSGILIPWANTNMYDASDDHNPFLLSLYSPKPRTTIISGIKDLPRVI